MLPGKALMDNLIGFILLCLFIINSPLGYLILIPLDYKYKLELFPWSAKREVTLEELEKLELMITEFREHHINMDSISD